MPDIFTEAAADLGKLSPEEWQERYARRVLDEARVCTETLDRAAKTLSESTRSVVAGFELQTKIGAIFDRLLTALGSKSWGKAITILAELAAARVTYLGVVSKLAVDSRGGRPSGAERFDRALDQVQRQRLREAREILERMPEGKPGEAS